MRIAMLLFILSLLPQLVCAQSSPLLTAREMAEAEAFYNRLLHDVHPDHKHNAYFPLALLEALRWVYQKRSAGELSIQVVNTDQVTIASAMMEIDHDAKGKPIIKLPAAVAIRTLRDAAVMQTRTGKRGLHNSFAVGLAHEAAHLRTVPRSFYSMQKSPETQKLVDQEEMRVWTLIDDTIVIPMMRDGEPLERSQVAFNQIRRTCYRMTPCPQLEAFVRGALLP